jgi:hypothetical protein
MENTEEMLVWFEDLSDTVGSNDFDGLLNKTHENKSIAAILWLYSKLNEDDKPQRWFLHGEHDMLYIGESFDIFQEFTKEDVKTALNLGIYPADDGDGFKIYASM